MKMQKMCCFVRLHWAGKACQYQTLVLLLGPFISNKENKVVVNTAPGAVFTTLHFLLNL